MIGKNGGKRAKQELKQDGHFQVPTKKSEPIIYQVKEVALQDRLVAEFRAAKGLKARAIVAHEMLKNLADVRDQAAAVKEVIPALNAEIATHQRTQPTMALEAIFVRDELRAGSGTEPIPAEIPAQTIWQQEINHIGATSSRFPPPNIGARCSPSRKAMPGTMG